MIWFYLILLVVGIFIYRNIKEIKKENQTLDSELENCKKEVGGMIFDGNKKRNSDDFMEDYRKDMCNITGMGGNDFDRNEVDKNTKDIRNTVHS